MNTQTTAEQVRQIENLAAFAKKSGIPYRTLCRIKQEAGHQMSPTTCLAIDGALKRYKPKMKAPEAV